MRYAVGGRSAANGAGEALATLWNPHASQSLYVIEFEVVSLGANSGCIGTLQRATVRGTPGSTITPDLDNSYSRRAAPPTGALLDLGDYTTNATLDTSILWRVNTPGGANTAGSGAHLMLGVDEIEDDHGIEVPFGTGLTYVSTQALSGGADVRFTWEES